MSDRTRRLQQLAFAAWLLLGASILSWPLGDSGIGWASVLVASMPLALPLPGMARGQRRSYGWAPMTLAPALTLALTEILVNQPGRWRASLTLALILVAFAALLAALRATRRA